jgi:small subunit ribosomal protein S5
MADYFSKPMPSSFPKDNKQQAGQGRGATPRRGGDRGPRRDEEPREFDQRTLDLARVTRVTKGGKRMRFRACVIVGDHKGRVGYGIAKGIDVQMAVNKAARKAQKTAMRIPIVQGTIPHMILQKFGAAQVILKPAPRGTGIKAGGATRVVLELSGVQNVVAKALGSNNKINNVRATMAALEALHVVSKDGRRGGAKAAAEALAANA